MTEFYVKIEMGNASMYSNHDVRYALGYIIGHLDCNMGGSIRDINGNVVGEYGYRD
jgi:hypothetical protein